MMYKKFKNLILKDNRGFLQKSLLRDIKKKTDFKIVETFYSYFSKPNVVMFQNQRNLRSSLPA